ncbi:hypothetical protein Tco_0179001 [Tanacetum coccineum]
MSSFEQRSCFSCGNPVDDQPCRYCTCERCGYYNRGVPCLGCNSEAENSFTYEPTPYSYNDSPNFSEYPPQPQYDTYFCELCGNDAHYGYDCPPQFLFVYDQDPCFNQNFDNNFPQTSPSFPQQFPCCENCEGPHENFQCQPMNQNFYEPNLCYNSISSGFDQFQPPQFPVIHQPPQETNTEILQARENIMKAIQAFLKKYDHLHPREKCMALLLAEDRFLKVKQALEEGQNQPENCPIFDDDDDEEYTIQVMKYYKNSHVAITPDFLITDSLIMKDEHLDTISEMESNEENEHSVEDLNLTPSESEDFSDIESECDVPVFDDFTTFSNPLFDSYDDSTSSDDESFSDEDVPKENFKKISNPLFDEEIISTKIDPHHFNAESDIKEYLLNRDTSIVSSLKFDSLLEEFFGEKIRLVEKLLYDNSSPRPPEELNSRNFDSIIESFSASPILVEGKGDILEELLNNDSLSLLENESFHFDRYYDPSSSRPSAKPPDDDDGIYFEAEPDTGILTVKVVDDISERYVLKPRILPTQPTLSLYPVIDTLLPFSSENEDNVFNPSILASKEEKSPHLLSHRGFKAFQHISDFSKIPMMIYRGNIPILDVQDSLEYEDLRAVVLSFVHSRDFNP